MNKNESNPYVGPRPFERNDEDSKRFFGRSHETQEIVSLIFGHPVMLVYAQSGAGKTSLFNTAITSKLENHGFDVMPLTRVGGVVLEGININDINNLYTFNALLKLDSGSKPKDLLTKTLSEFLSQRSRHMDKTGKPLPRAIIFDQFEELFTYTPKDWREQRNEFFQQVVDAVEADPLLRVVFVIREDYVAEMDPYARDLPERLRIRYRLERLGEDAALHAIKDPLDDTTRKFADGVAEGLVEELLATRAVDATGSTTQIKGQYVEPVQLQVVCVTLWSSLGDSVKEIKQEHLKNFDVNSALSDFYNSAIEDTVEETKVDEMSLRNWFGKTLITPMGTRSTVFQGATSTGGIDNSAVKFLENRHIIRADIRAGNVRWYELTHDRFIDAIVENNKDWFARKSKDTGNPLKEAAQEWERLYRDKGSLLRGARLDEADAWAKKHPEQLNDLEREFLRGSQEQRQNDLILKAKTAGRLRGLTIGLAAFLFIAAFAANTAVTQRNVAREAQSTSQANEKIALYAQATSQANEIIALTARADSESYAVEANAQRQRAEITADQALAGNLAAQADSLKNSDYRLALLLGLEAYQRDEESLLTRSTLFQLLQFTPYGRFFDFDGTISAISVSPDGTLIAVASCGGYLNKQCSKGEIKLFDADMTSNIANLSDVFNEFGIVYSLTFHEYGGEKILAAGGCVPTDIADQFDPNNHRGCTDNKGQITLWNVTTPANPHLIVNTLEKPAIANEHTGRVKTLAFSPDGKTLASGSYDQSIQLWDITDIANPIPVSKLEGHLSFVNSVVFIDDKTLVSAGDDRAIIRWDLSLNGQPPKFYRENHTAPVTTLVYNHTSGKLASAGDDNLVFLWNWNAESQTLQNPIKLVGHKGYVRSLAFNRNGNMLASAGFDNTIILWEVNVSDSDDTPTVTQIGPGLGIHTGAINAVAFGDKDDQPYLVSGSDDRTVIRWDLSAREPVSKTLQMDKPESMPVSDVNYEAVLNGQQIELTRVGSDSAAGGLYLVLDGFTPGTYFFFDNNKFFTFSNIEGQFGLLTEWIIDPQMWMDKACKAAKRNMSDSELKLYLKLPEEQIINYQHKCP